MAASIPQQNGSIAIIQNIAMASETKTSTAIAIQDSVQRQPSPLEGLKRAFRRDPETNSMFGQFSSVEMAVAFAAELVGTAVLLFLGCMGGLQLGDGKPNFALHIQGSLVFGITVATVIQIIGHVTNAHINPAVTLCALIKGDVNIAAAGLFVVAQCIGSVLGYGLMLTVVPLKVRTSNGCKCTTEPSDDVTTLQALLCEVLVTSILIFLCMGVWDRRNSRNTDSTPIKFGLLVAAVSMAEGPLTGASMNPARTLGPAVWNNEWKSHWIYWVGPLLGSTITTLFYTFTIGRQKPARQDTDKGESLPLN